MIGLVFGSTFETACQKLDKMLEDWVHIYKMKNIEILHKSSDKYVVRFGNQTWQAAIPQSECRWRRCNVALIDRNIPQETIDEYILPYVNLKPWTAIGYYKLN